MENIANGNDDPTVEAFRALRVRLCNLRDDFAASESQTEAQLADVDVRYRASAVNLIHYLVSRQVDLRPLQLELGRYGLSSLGRIEGHVADAVDQVIARIDESLAYKTGSSCELRHARPTSAREGDDLLHRHSQALFGPMPPGHPIYVMVTAPNAAEVNAAWLDRLLGLGVNVLRLNCAHEELPQWQHIVKTARRAAKARGVTLRVLVDLPGPKLRTVALARGPEVERWKPQRDAFGRVTSACHVVLRPAEPPAPREPGPELRFPATLWAELSRGDQLRFRDARGRKRRLLVLDRSEQRGIAALERTAYVLPGTTVQVRRGTKKIGKFQVGEVLVQPFRLSLVEGQRFRLRAGADAGPPGVLPEMGCSLREPLLALKPGARVLFDDGKLECVVEGQELNGVLLRVTHAPGGKFRLSAEKGINLPDTPLGGPSLGPDDEIALKFAVESADIVGASFVRNPDDVRTLYARLHELGADRLGVILKIETVTAFKQLPAILLAGMSRYQLGVMIARGDLAVEAGFERLAELQEEMLWLCEAAHLPVVWATQVLDQMARTGQATRAEITDAAMSVRAECVMLNKGAYIAQAVSTLTDILFRMKDHQYKKRSLSRPLHLEVPASIQAAASARPLRE